jgi:hypothetical protein
MPSGIVDGWSTGSMAMLPWMTHRNREFGDLFWDDDILGEKN